MKSGLEPGFVYLRVQFLIYIDGYLSKRSHLGESQDTSSVPEVVYLPSTRSIFTPW